MHGLTIIIDILWIGHHNWLWIDHHNWLLFFCGFYKLGARGSVPAGAFFSPKKWLLYFLKGYFLYFSDFWLFFVILQARCSVQRPRRGFFFRQKSDFYIFWRHIFDILVSFDDFLCIFSDFLQKYSDFFSGRTADDCELIRKT